MCLPDLGLWKLKEKMKFCNGRNNEHWLMPQVNNLLSLFKDTEKFPELFKSLNI